MQVLANRLGTLGGEHRALTAPATVEALVAMRLNGLVVDLAVLGPSVGITWSVSARASPAWPSWFAPDNRRSLSASAA